MKKIISIFSVSAFISSFLLFIPLVHAQQTSLNLTAYPSTFSITAKPGSTTKETFKLKNNTNNPLPLSLSLKKLTTDSQGNVTIADFTKNDTYDKWISFQKNTITASPQEWVDVNFTLTVPKDSAFGYYYVIYITPSETNSKNNNSAHATLTGSLAIPILLTVDKPGATIDGKMTTLQSLSSFEEYLPIIFNTTFVNSGNIHIRPTGNIFIKDWTGKLVDTLIINSAGNSILPNGKRTYQTTWDNSFITQEPIIQDDTVLKDANGNPKTHLVFHFDRVLNLRIGKYTAIALAVIPTPKRDLSFQLSTTFWVFPWGIILGAILFIGLAGLGLFNIIKNIAHSVKKMFKK